MKKAILFLFLVSGSLIGYSQKLEPCMKKEKKSPEQIAQKQANRMQERLGLSEEQRDKVYKVMLGKTEKVKAIKEKHKPELEKMKEEIKAIKEKYKPGLEAMKEEMKKMKEAAKKEFEAILTKEQQEKQKQLKKRRIIKKKIIKRRRVVPDKDKLWMNDKDQLHQEEVEEEVEEIKEIEE